MSEHNIMIGQYNSIIAFILLSFYLSICCKIYNKPGRKQEIVHEYHYYLPHLSKNARMLSCSFDGLFMNRLKKKS